MARPPWSLCVCGGGSSVYNGRACGVKLCSLAPVTVSDHVTVKASSEILGQRAVQSQLVSLFKLFLPEELLQTVCDLIRYDKVSVNLSPALTCKGKEGGVSNHLYVTRVNKVDLICYPLGISIGVKHIVWL